MTGESRYLFAITDGRGHRSYAIGIGDTVSSARKDAESSYSLSMGVSPAISVVACGCSSDAPEFIPGSTERLI